MTCKAKQIHFVVLFLTLLVAAWSYLQPQVVQEFDLLIFAAIIILIGIPHGASDYFTHKFLSEKRTARQNTLAFYFQYLFTITLYAVLWWVAPALAFILFILISIYHFGQSALYHINLSSNVIRFLCYSTWGAFALLSPVVLNFPETRPILDAILRQSTEFGPVIQKYSLSIFFLLGSVNVGMVLLLFSAKRLSGVGLTIEILNLGVLGVLFYSTPLLVAFSIYFGLWHALETTFKQVQMIRKARPNFTLLTYYWKALPVTLISVLGICLLIFLVGERNALEGLIATFFVLLSIITLPHVIVINKLYRVGN